MIKQLINFILGCFKSGEGRTQKLKRNVVWSFIIKFAQMGIELLKVPILLSYLDNEKYGIWLTIVSILLWTHQFDLGLGSGLRYKLTESIAHNDINRGKSLVSTAYISMAIIMGIVIIILIPICSFLDWNSILNVKTIQADELILTVISILALFGMQFVMDLISVVLKADQRSAISDVFKPLASVLSLAVVLLLGLFSSNSLLYASLAMAAPYVLVMFVANLYYFNKDYKMFKPSLSFAKTKYLKDIYSLGLKYFISQGAALVVFSTSNILISRYVNPTEVTTYNIANTYFSLIVVFYTMILVPFSAAITDAYVRDDFDWIKRSMRNLNKVALLASLGIIMMLFVSKFAIHLWVGDKVILPLSLCLVMALYNILSVWVSPYANFLGGVGKLSVRVYIGIFKIITFIPVAIWFIKLWGVVGIVIAIIILNTLINLVFGLVQYKMIINKTAKGIWNR